MRSNLSGWVRVLCNVIVIIVPFLCAVKPELNGWGAWSIVFVAWVVFMLLRWQESREYRRSIEQEWRSIEQEIQWIVHVVKLEPMLGDPQCKFSARSSIIRCAVNPAGSCDGCKDREVVAIDSSVENLSKDS